MYIFIQSRPTYGLLPEVDIIMDFNQSRPNYDFLSEIDLTMDLYPK